MQCIRSQLLLTTFSSNMLATTYITCILHAMVLCCYGLDNSTLTILTNKTKLGEAINATMDIKPNATTSINASSPINSTNLKTPYSINVNTSTIDSSINANSSIVASNISVDNSSIEEMMVADSSSSVDVIHQGTPVMRDCVNGTADLTSDCVIKMYNLTQDCAKATGATQEDVDIAMRMEIPSSDTGKCLTRCLLKFRGVMSPEGAFASNATVEYLTKINEEESLRVEFQKLADYCYGKLKLQPMSCLDTCQFAYDIALCSEEFHKTLFLRNPALAPPINAITTP